MSTKNKKQPATSLVLMPKKEDPMDRIAAVAERLATKLFERDREAQDREQKLREKALEIIQQIVEKKPGDELFGMLEACVKEFSKGLEKVVDLKKLEAMTPKERFKMVSRRA
jgi:hypothetical protein